MQKRWFLNLNGRWIGPTLRSTQITTLQENWVEVEWTFLETEIWGKLFPWSCILIILQRLNLNKKNFSVQLQDFAFEGFVDLGQTKEEKHVYLHDIDFALKLPIMNKTKVSRSKIILLTFSAGENQVDRFLSLGAPFAIVF